MAKLNQKQFRKTYGGLELLRTSLSTYKVGHKAEWERRIRKIFEIEEVFVTAFLGLEKSVQENLDQGLAALATSTAVDANFANLEFSGETEISAAMKAGKIPADASAGLQISKTKSFSFEDITARSLKDQLRSDFITAVRNIQLQNERAYKKIRKLMFIDRLYYAGSISLEIDRSVDVQTAADIEKAGGKFSVGASRDMNRTVTFSNAKDAPFAVKFETIEDLIN